jgi:hypothetical protein
MTINKWTTSEDEFLRENLQTKSVEELAKILGRGVRSVKTRYFDIGLHKLRKDLWTLEEEEVIKKNCQTKTDAEISKMLDKKTESVVAYHRSQILKIKSSIMWTLEEDKILKENLNLTDFEIAKILGRTTKGIMAKRYRFGLKKGRLGRKEWDREEFREDWNMAKNRDELVKKYGLVWRLIVARARTLVVEGFDVNFKKFNVSLQHKQGVHISIAFYGKKAEFLTHNYPNRGNLSDYIRGLIERDMKE